MRVAAYYTEMPVASTNVPVDQWFKIGENLRTGEDDFRHYFGEPTTLERDLLVVAAAIFATDLLVKRGKREEITRDIHLTIAVVNYHALEGQRVALERILHFLSHDNWTLAFLPEPGMPEPLSYPAARNGKALLFSGGLDSLAAAVDLLDTFGFQRVLLASHLTGNTFTIRAQSQLHAYLEAIYGGTIDRVAIRTGGKNTEDMEFTNEPEVSQRTRSFTFLTIACLAARRRGMSEIVMIAENGQMAIHLPLSAGRIGAFSTHTAHPKFVREVAQFFSAVMQYPIDLQNPFVHKTKAEVVAQLALSHQQAVRLSTSCWKSWRVGGLHCGECVPCYVRRIALEYQGVQVDRWKRDVFIEDVGALDMKDEGKRNLTELARFAADFRTLPDFELDMTYCELFSTDFDHDAAVAMYRRFAEEAREVLSRYPALAHLI